MMVHGRLKIMESRFDSPESMLLLNGELAEGWMLLQKIQVLIRKKEQSYELI